MISVFPTSRKLFFLSPFRTVLSAIHMQVTDRVSPDAPSLTQAIFVQMVHFVSGILKKDSEYFSQFYLTTTDCSTDWQTKSQKKCVFTNQETLLSTKSSLVQKVVIVQSISFYKRKAERKRFSYKGGGSSKSHRTKKVLNGVSKLYRKPQCMQEVVLRQERGSVPTSPSSEQLAT